MCTASNVRLGPRVSRQTMLTVAMAVLIFGGVLALGIFMLRWQQRRAEQLIEQWAKRHSYRVLEQEERTALGEGPMNRYAKNKAIVHAVKVADPDGKIRRARLTVGSPDMGVLSEQVSVEWEPSLTRVFAQRRESSSKSSAPDSVGTTAAHPP